MANSLYPGFIRMFYTSNAHNHVMTIPVKPFFSVGGSWFLEQKNGGAGDLWTTILSAYVTVLKALVPAPTVFVSADLFTMADATADPLYEESFALGVVGTNGGAVQALSQLNLSFRTAEGGRANIRLMETSAVININTALSAPYTGNAALVALNNYAVGATSPLVGRDGGFLRAGIRALFKTNDKLREEFVLNV